MAHELPGATPTLAELKKEGIDLAGAKVAKTKKQKDYERRLNQYVGKIERLEMDLKEGYKNIFAFREGTRNSYNTIVENVNQTRNNLKMGCLQLALQTLDDQSKLIKEEGAKLTYDTETITTVAQKFVDWIQKDDLELSEPNFDDIKVDGGKLVSM